MKKHASSFFLVVGGAVLWFFLSMAAHNSMKKWDGKFASVLRQNLSQSGLSDEDVLFSANVARSTGDVPWATQNIELKQMTPERAASLKQSLQAAGARVEETTEGKEHTLLVKRGHRLYQKITFNLQ